MPGRPGARVGVRRAERAVVDRGLAHDDVEDLQVRDRGAGRALVDDQSRVEVADGERRRRGRVDRSDLGAGDDHALPADPASPERPRGDLDLLLAFQRLEQRLQFRVDGALDDDVGRGMGLGGRGRQAGARGRAAAAQTRPDRRRARQRRRARESA